MDTPAYKLTWDFDEVNIRDAYDARLVAFPGWDSTAGLIGCHQLALPQPVLFEADFRRVSQTDYPYSDEGWPIMSPRMVDVLRTIGEFPHRRIPVRFLNQAAFADQRYLPDGRYRPEAVDDRFVAVQVSEYVDVVDWTNSVYTRNRVGPFEFTDFETLVLREPADGLPPVFRIREQASLFLVSAAARQALEDADIRGIAFESLPGIGPPPQRD
ncbi:imm11 family protein [Haliangium ochraceum]|nr:DUF1629 domain-containing protein [Haliangium ochraceum]